MILPIIVLPLKMIVFQTALLIVAIAVEAVVLRRELILMPRTSIQYATTINFLSTLVGWLLFFSFHSLAPAAVRRELMNCIFFDRWQQEFIPWFFLAAVLTFFVSFFVKLGGLTGLKYFLGEQETLLEVTEEPPQKRLLYQRRGQAVEDTTPPKTSILIRDGNAVLQANAASYTMISLILLIRFLVQGSITPS